MTSREQVRHGQRFRLRLAILLPLTVTALVGQSCLLRDEHILTVENETAHSVDGLVVGIQTDQMPVPRLAPGASTVIRLRVNAESHWDVYAVHGAERKLLGVCGYTGTTPGRPTEFTLRLVPPSSGATGDCVVKVG